MRTKIEISPAIVRRVSGLDDLARIFFPDNRNHRRAFIAIWVAIKYADGQFFDSALPLNAGVSVSQRTIEIVRAKLKKMGLLKRVGHFNPSHGHRSGWTFSSRFRSCLRTFACQLESASVVSRNPAAQAKDTDSADYV